MAMTDDPGSTDEAMYIPLAYLSMLHTLHAHPSGTIASHRIALPQHHIITHACPPITTARGHRAVEHRYAVTWRGVTSFGQPSSVPANCQSQKPAMRAISGPWELLPLQLHHCTLPRCTTQDWQQATPVCAKVTARSTPRPITPSIYSRVPEPLALHPGVLPLVSDPHQRCGTPPPTHSTAPGLTSNCLLDK
jgi:hypothetical protein